MDDKKKYRVGADLIFDIDCDMLPTGTLEEAYFYALKLVDILKYVYGFQEVLLVFSGRRGYHVHVQDFKATRLNLKARRDIIKYLTDNPNLPHFVPIDSVVTGDIARLIRLPGSLYVKEEHVGICKLLEIPQIELVRSQSPIAYRHHLIITET